jgi:hypothetical protein
MPMADWIFIFDFEEARTIKINGGPKTHRKVQAQMQDHTDKEVEQIHHCSLKVSQRRKRINSNGGVLSF